MTNTMKLKFRLPKAICAVLSQFETKESVGIYRAKWLFALTVFLSQNVWAQSVDESIHVNVVDVVPCDPSRPNYESCNSYSHCNKDLDLITLRYSRFLQVRKRVGRTNRIQSFNQILKEYPMKYHTNTNLNEKDLKLLSELSEEVVDHGKYGDFDSSKWNGNLRAKALIQSMDELFDIYLDALAAKKFSKWQECKILSNKAGMSTVLGGATVVASLPVTVTASKLSQLQRDQKLLAEINRLNVLLIQSPWNASLPGGYGGASSPSIDEANQ